MKLIAYVLPQFHRIPENDDWWGEGFTEWTNTRKAVPLYPGHLQPKEPMQQYYYDLTDASARIRQAEWAKAHGIYGFCYYHYWFKGKRLLDKPVREIHRSGEPSMPFCLSWANESWTRKWDGGEHELLIKQEYGDEGDWEHHFYELLPLFKDERYIRIDGKPVFIIYRPGNIPRWKDMCRQWNRLAEENGLDGVYFVRTLGGFEVPEQPGFDASVEFEPHYTFAHGDSRRLWQRMNLDGQEHLVFDYDQLWLSILSRIHRRSGEKIFPGAYVNWDNTPRLGTRGQSCIGASPRKFGHYLSRQMERAKTLYQSEFLFINAWNEWAEGAFLEPDERNGFAYLEEVRAALKLAGYEQALIR
ncbi:glycoside hydrolase family 99-like domain-containing protein [Paenibacillus tepidiphilus]|uniref:glycosyltransferase WbsX family protein n=1 Tax=Paenibacillus tepidiphilus TaxID=2608683 RepID=UPI00123AAFBF|nr:glycoside hydrolase family 99-like domain-containing protein [Paenibacillus tepidiphilus]